MSVFLRKSGRYAVLVDLDASTTGKRRRRSLGTYRTRKEAERAERDAKSARDRGIDLAPQTVTVADLMGRFLVSRKQQWSVRTHERFCEVAQQYINRHLGSQTLAKLRPVHIAEWSSMLRERGGMKDRPLSPKTVAYCYSLLRQALGWAVRMQLADRNVTELCDAPKVPRREAKAYTPDEVGRLLKQSHGTRLENIIAFAIATGARRGEIAALRWDDVDLEDRKVTMRISLSETRAGGVTEKCTKTGRTRVVPLSAGALSALRNERAKQAQDRLVSGGMYKDLGRVFQGPGGGNVGLMAITDGFRKIARRASVQVTSFHGLRHTAATWMLAEGIDLRTTASVLGHSTAATTLSVYAHVVAGAQESAVDAIDQRLRGALGK